VLTGHLRVVIKWSSVIATFTPIVLAKKVREVWQNGLRNSSLTDLEK